MIKSKLTTLDLYLTMTVGKDTQLMKLLSPHTMGIYTIFLYYKYN